MMMKVQELIVLRGATMTARYNIVVDC